MVTAIILILIIEAVLAKLTSKPKYWRFFLINVAVMAGYNIVTWGCLLMFYNNGEQGMLLVFWLVIATGIHLAFLFICTIVTAIKTAVKEQTRLQS